MRSSTTRKRPSRTTTAATVMSGCGLTAAECARVSAQDTAERGFRLVGDPYGIEFGQVDPRDGRVVEVGHAFPGARLRAKRDGKARWISAPIAVVPQARS